MTSRFTPSNFAVLLLATSIAFVIAPTRLFAHCDRLDGPVVKAAAKALETRQVAFVLPWVDERDELEIIAAFEHALEVRALGTRARALADTYFFETVVRVHRRGEGEPYSGLKPAGQGFGPAISAAEAAIADGSAQLLAEFLASSLTVGVLGRLQDVVAAANYQPADLRAARLYIKAYTEFIEYVERVYEAISNGEGDHIGETLSGVGGQD